MIEPQPKLSEAEFTHALRSIGEQKYHHRHPFHLLMHQGRLGRGQLQAWAFNRFYYQIHIPVKDSLILARSQDAEFRRAWRTRIEDQDGTDERPGGLARWIELVKATGIPAEQLARKGQVLPGVRYAVEEYLRLVSHGTLLQAVASSLTEMFASRLIALRLDRLREHYPWLAGALQYFEHRLTEAPRDADFALRWVLSQAETREQQEQAIAALSAKCDILWAQLDAIYFAYVEPGWPPFEAFHPREHSHAA
jgi:pyrroloquinoline-quinone synthase